MPSRASCGTCVFWVQPLAHRKHFKDSKVFIEAQRERVRWEQEYRLQNAIPERQLFDDYPEGGPDKPEWFAQCRRYPPQASPDDLALPKSRGLWPVTKYSEWCGEWAQLARSRQPSFPTQMKPRPAKPAADDDE
jgi:hypothetical protein